MADINKNIGVPREVGLAAFTLLMAFIFTNKLVGNDSSMAKCIAGLLVVAIPAVWLSVESIKHRHQMGKFFHLAIGSTALICLVRIIDFVTSISL